MGEHLAKVEELGEILRELEENLLQVVDPPSDKGVLTEDELSQEKAKVLAG